MHNFGPQTPSPALKPSPPTSLAMRAYATADGKVTWNTVHPGTDS